MKKVILASTSPRRKELLSSVCGEFEVIPPTAEEISAGEPDFVALINAIKKGRSIERFCDLLIACDTLVALDGEIFGKPHTEENAVRMLKKMQGRTHEVISGVYLRAKNVEYAFTEKSEVSIKNMTDDEINEYVRTCKPLDKAGAYGIQDGKITVGFRGDYDNIVGLPLTRIREILRDL